MSDTYVHNYGPSSLQKPRTCPCTPCAVSVLLIIIASEKYFASLIFVAFQALFHTLMLKRLMKYFVLQEVDFWRRFVTVQTN